MVTLVLVLLVAVLVYVVIRQQLVLVRLHREALDSSALIEAAFVYGKWRGTLWFFEQLTSMDAQCNGQVIAVKQLLKRTTQVANSVDAQWQSWQAQYPAVVEWTKGDQS